MKYTARGGPHDGESTNIDFDLVPGDEWRASSWVRADGGWANQMETYKVQGGCVLDFVDARILQTVTDDVMAANKVAFEQATGRPAPAVPEGIAWG